MALTERKKETKNSTPHSLITEEHVRSALAKDKGRDAILQSWNICDFTKKGDNYASFVSSVNVQFNLNGQTSKVSYVVKLNPLRDMEGSQEFEHIAFQKEYEIYSALIPEMNAILVESGCYSLKVPKFLHGSLEDEKELIFFEDLRAKNFQMLDRKKGMSVYHLRLVLQELGKLHAASLLLQEKYRSSRSDLLKSHEILGKDLSTFGDKASGDFMKVIEKSIDNCAMILEAVPGYEKAITWIKGLTSQLLHIFRDGKLSKKCNVICHGDAWNNNILFRYNEKGEPIDLMLLDFQLSRFASPATDLNYLLYTSVDAPVRVKNLENLLLFYYNSFSSTLAMGGMETPITEVELKVELREQIPFGAVMTMMVMPLVLMEGNDTPDMDNMTDIKEFGHYVQSGIEKMLTKNTNLRPRFLAMFDEFEKAGMF